MNGVGWDNNRKKRPLNGSSAQQDRGADLTEGRALGLWFYMINSGAHG